eukprot:5843731-Amphidinium_carterae.1
METKTIGYTNPPHPSASVLHSILEGTLLSTWGAGFNVLVGQSGDSIILAGFQLTTTCVLHTSLSSSMVAHRQFGAVPAAVNKYLQ